MSTTTGAPVETDAFTEIADAEDPFEQRLEQARQERTRLGHQQRDYATKLRTAAAEYETLAADSDQFDATGQPLKGSRAAKLRVVLEGAKTSRLPSMIAGADRRVEQVEAEWRASGPRTPLRSLDANGSGASRPSLRSGRWRVKCSGGLAGAARLPRPACTGHGPAG